MPDHVSKERLPAWGWAVIGGIGLIYLAALAIFFALMWDMRRNIDVVTDRLPTAMLGFERAIGYGGLIHNYKNHVLRSYEVGHADAAIENHDTAMQALDLVERIATDAGLDIRTAEIRATLDRYRDMIGAVGRAHAQGRAIDPVDPSAEMSDLPALEGLRAAHDQIAAALTREIEHRRGQIGVLTIVISALMLLLPAAGLTVLGLKRRSERAYVARIEALNSGLDRQNEQLEAANHALSVTNSELNEFAHAAAHDLRTPLRGIAHQAEYLVEAFRDRMDQEVTERLIHVQALCARLDRGMTLLLRYARLAPPVTVDMVDPVGVIEEIEVGIAPKLVASGGAIAIETALPPVRCKRFDLGVVLQKLIENGLTYNEATQKRIAIGFLPLARIDGEELRDLFYVRDNGIGIPPEHQDDVFVMFKRLHHDDAYGPGAGAGLSFAKKVVENYRGVIRMKSEPGAGSSVYFSFTPLQAQQEHSVQDAPTARKTLRAAGA